MEDARAACALVGGPLRYVVWQQGQPRYAGYGGNTEIGEAPADEIYDLAVQDPGTTQRPVWSPPAYDAAHRLGVTAVNTPLNATYVPHMCAYHGCWMYAAQGCELRRTVADPIWAAPWLQIGAPSPFAEGPTPTAICSAVAADAWTCTWLEPPAGPAPPVAYAPR